LFVVEQSNARAYPGTVVVHTHHALVAHAAVVGTRRLDFVARLAELKSVEVICGHSFHFSFLVDMASSEGLESNWTLIVVV